MVKHFPQARVRLPPDVMKYVEDEAQEAASSKNSVIVRAIRAAMKVNGPAATGIAPDLNTTQPR